MYAPNALVVIIFCPIAHSGTGINHTTTGHALLAVVELYQKRKTLAIFVAIYYKIAVLILDIDRYTIE